MEKPQFKQMDVCSNFQFLKLFPSKRTNAIKSNIYLDVALKMLQRMCERMCVRLAMQKKPQKQT